nr:hypothetical protein [uncultured Olsenella sp.]
MTVLERAVLRRLVPRHPSTTGDFSLREEYDAAVGASNSRTMPFPNDWDAFRLAVASLVRRGYMARGTLQGRASVTEAGEAVWMGVMGTKGLSSLRKSGNLGEYHRMMRLRDGR